MAVAAEALAGGEAGAEGMSPEARSAVSQAAAGRGKRLTPEVAGELRRRASRKTKAAPSASKSSDGGGISLPSPGGAVKTASRAAGAVSSPGGRSNIAFRVVLAFGAFILALELASYLSGRYFTYSLGKGGQHAKKAAQAIELYPGQSAALRLRAELPSSDPIPGVV